MKLPNNPLITFITRILIFSLIILSIGVLLFTTVLKEYYLDIHTYTFVFFIVLTIIVHLIILKASKKKMVKFAPYFMLSNAIKIFIYFLYIGVYLFFNKEDAIPFIITFLSLYLLFTVFEVNSILRYLKS